MGALKIAGVLFYNLTVLSSLMDKRLVDRNQEMLELFSESSSWEGRYRKIIALGKELKPFPEKERLPELLVKGCVAKVWLKASLNERGEMELSGDGEKEALISRGLLALMLLFYSSRRPKDILNSEPLFLKELELSQHLSPSRTNGLNSLIKQIRYYAQAFLLISSKEN